MGRRRRQVSLGTMALHESMAKHPVVLKSKFALCAGIDPNKDLRGGLTPTTNTATVVGSEKGLAHNFVAASSQYLSYPDADQLDFGTSTLFTLSAWVNLTSTSTQGIFDKINQSPGVDGFSFHYNAGLSALRMTLVTDGGVNNVTYDGTIDIANTGWRHVAVVMQFRQSTPGADDMEIYVDGVPDGTLNITGGSTNSSLDNSLPLLLGARLVGSITNHLDGQIGIPLIHREALSQSQILGLIADTRNNFAAGFRRKPTPMPISTAAAPPAGTLLSQMLQQGLYSGSKV